MSVSSRPKNGNPLRIWDVERLWALSSGLPVRRIALESLGELDRVAWIGAEQHGGRLTVREIAEHARRIMDADLEQPILLSAEGHLRGGFHRLAKAHMLGLPDLPAVQFPENPAPDRVRDMPEWLYRSLFPARD